jgi:hypothetical protein
MSRTNWDGPPQRFVLMRGNFHKWLKLFLLADVYAGMAMLYADDYCV